MSESSTQPPHQHPEGGDCSWCPVCRLAAVLRGEDAEAIAKIVAAGTGLIEGLRTLLARLASQAGADEASAGAASQDTSASASTDATAPGGPAGAAAERPAKPRVQRIDLET